MTSTLPKSSLIAFLVAGAFFMENLDGTVIATALPAMAKDRKSTRLNSSHVKRSRMPSSA